jgi:hypothetical protein
MLSHAGAGYGKYTIRCAEAMQNLCRERGLSAFTYFRILARYTRRPQEELSACTEKYSQTLRQRMPSHLW